MSETIPITQAEHPVIPSEAFEDLPIFPLPGALLLPRTLTTLHIFEPRYRRMMEDIIDGHRVVAVGLFEEDAVPDEFGRPPIFGYAGIGVLRRSARLPDGRFNIVLEGVSRVEVIEELPPAPSVPYRRVRARPFEDLTRATDSELQSASAGVRSLCSRVVAEFGENSEELMSHINDVEEPGLLADTIAVAAAQDASDRELILAEADPAKRLEIVSGMLGTFLLRAPRPGKGDGVGWGFNSGEA